jgi:undecaprenyl-diphosphatase
MVISAEFRCDSREGSPGEHAMWHQVMTWDALLISYCNRYNRAWCGRIFSYLSRLGDGWIWGMVMLCMLLLGDAGQRMMVVAMLLCGVVATLVYKIIKHSTHRLRPCDAHQHINTTVRPLDRYSFPSGHTMHAVAFTLIACEVCPPLAYFLWPLTLGIALSRLVLGLHYATDVMVGAGIGATLALFTMQCANYAALMS